MPDNDQVETMTEAVDAPPVQSWSEIVSTGPTAAISNERLQGTLAELEGRLSAPVAQAVQDSLGHLVGLEVSTYLDLLGALTTLLGEELGSFTGYMITERAYLSSNDDLGRAAAPQAWVFLKVMAAMYGTQLSVAYERATRPRGDWLYINRQTRVDQLTGTSTIWIELEQVSGEKVVLECPPGSMLRLVAHELHCLNAVPNKEAFTEDVLNEVRDAIHQFLEFTQPAPPVPLPPDHQETPAPASVDVGSGSVGSSS